MDDKINTSTAELTRYHPSEFGDDMIQAAKGQWVSISDVEADTQAVLARAEQAEAREKQSLWIQCARGALAWRNLLWIFYFV